MESRFVSSLSKLQRGLDRLSLIFGIAGALGIFILMMLTAIGVIWRYVLVSPIFGLQDVSSMTAAVVAACAVAFGASQQSHITVNIMPKQFGRSVRRVTDIIARSCGVIVLILAAQALVKKGNCGLPCGNVTGNLTIPHGPFYYILAAALGFFALVLAVHLLTGIAHWASEDPNEVAD